MTMIRTLNEIEGVPQYLSRIGAELRSLKTAVVKETVGNYWRDVAVIRFDKNGVVTASDPEYAPTEQEQLVIADRFKKATFPKIKQLARPLRKMPPGVEMNDDLFEFIDMESRVTMLQQRRTIKGDKAYVPWTYWTDNEWRMLEPDGPLPLFNLPAIKDNTTVFIHEGAKAARVAQNVHKNPKHPWREELSNAAHVGWIGGAMNPRRTDWSLLQRYGVKRAYIVADNDWPGLNAVPAISQQLGCVTFLLQFTDEFPTGFDLGDPFPDVLFRESGGHRYYVGPAFADCLHPATWSTDTFQSDKGRPKHVLRESAKAMWAYVEEADLFVCREMPSIVRQQMILDKMLAPYSHVMDTGKLIIKAQRGRTTRIAYRPDVSGFTITDKGTSAINLHTPTRIKPAEGDPSPWLEFLEYLLPNERERKEVEKWCATLIACPEVRIGYGLLMISETQGIGKTTLAANVLAPLVGWDNVSVPSEQDILSQFNGWIAQRRLAIINEIYTGSSWKSYHLLKSAITDRELTVNQKYVRQYAIENWCHIYACSNSRRALKVESSDRRWYYPEINELMWPKEKFTALREWLDSGGLGIIYNWALRYGIYVSPSEHAPLTASKEQLIEESMSEGQKEAVRLARIAEDSDEAIILLSRDIREWVKQQMSGQRLYDTELELIKSMVNSAKVYTIKDPARIRLDGARQYVLGNAAAVSIVRKGASTGERNTRARDLMRKPKDIVEESL